MPIMNKDQLLAFDAENGAYSTVTEREATGDRSITLDKHEKKVLSLGYDLESFPRQKADTHRSTFIIHTQIGESSGDLAVKHPKPKGNELRLYMADAQYFSGSSGDIFFIFTKRGSQELHVGFMPPKEWERKTVTGVEGSGIDFPEDDALYQELLNQPYPDLAKDASEVKQMRIPRAIRAALEALENANFECEMDPTHETFISLASGKNYIEAHHLMPLKQQSSYSYNLDIPENIVALCPTCHRKFHHAVGEMKEHLLVAVYTRRKEKLTAFGLTYTLPQLFNAYHVM
jgi:5-methylcytosine-specific restriction protein A